MKKTHKENNTKVIIPKEIITYLMDLADTLFEKDYYSYIEYANILIDDILDFIHTLPHAPHYNLSHTAEMRFNRYGKDLQYAFFKRKSSKHTTWYVFFNRKGDRYIIGSPDKPGGLSIQLCKSEKKEFYIRYSS